MLHIKLFPQTGSFAENKDIARDIRVKKIIPALQKKQKIILDFENIDSATQSFVHALISDLIRKFSSQVLDEISFKSCSKSVKKIINIVVNYMQEGDF